MALARSRCISYAYVCTSLVTMLLLAAHCSAIEEDGAAKAYDTDTFKQEVSTSNHFVMFYAPWCGHCKRLHPTWDDLAAKYNNDADSEVVVAKVDCTTETSLCSDQDVTGYPTLKFFKKDSESAPEKYRGQRDLASLNKFIGKQMGVEVEEIVVEPEAAVVDKGLYILNDKSFAEHIKTGDHFIKFYAPWCGHCQKLAPTWEELAAEFQNDKIVKVGKLDCTASQSLCQENEVKGYPTLAYFSNGKKVETYRGARTLSELRDFLKSMQEVPEAASKDADEKDRVPDIKDDGKKKEAAPSPVVSLNSDTFSDVVSKAGVVTFVKFFAPWCGHCKRMAPTWDELAQKYADVDDVVIAKVDCTSHDNKNKELCNKEGVNGFPTLNLYKDGKKLKEYSGSRELQDLQAFIQKNTVDEKKKDEL